MATTACFPDRARGSASRIAFQDEPCWGTPDYVHQQPRGLDLVNESIINRINRIQSQIIRSNRMKRKSQQGNQRPGGDINGELQANTWPMLLRHALCRNSAVTTTGSGPYTHRFIGQVDLDDGLTIEKRFGFRDHDDIVLQYMGSRVNQFFFSAPTEGIVTCRAGVLSRQEKQVFDDALATEDGSMELIRAAEYATDNEPFNSFHCALELDGTPILMVKQFDFLLDNNMDAEAFALTGRPYRADLTEDERAMTGNLTAFFTPDSYDLFYPAFLDNADFGVRILFERGLQSIEVFLPAINVSGDITPAIRGKGPLDLQGITWEAHEDDVTGHDIEVTVVSHDPVLNTAA